MSDDVISKLVNNAFVIERHYKASMDIEWAVKDDEIYILQARKITTDYMVDSGFLDKDFEGLPAVKPVKKSLRETVLFNLEKIPRPFYPLDFDFANILGVEKQRLLSELGISMNDMNTMNEDGISGFDLTGIRPNLNIFCLVKNFRQMKNHKENIKISEKLLSECQGRYEAEIKLHPRSAAEIRDSFIRMKKLIQDTAYSRFKYAVFPLVIENKSLEKMLKKLDKSYSAFDLMDGLSYVTTDINRDMKKIAEVIVGQGEVLKAVKEKSYSKLCDAHPDIGELFDSFMKKYGNKSDFNCYCFDAKSWLDEPDRFLNTLRVLVKSLEESHSQEEELGSKYRDILQRVRTSFGEKKYLKFKEKVDAVRHYYYIREASQYLWESEFRYCRLLLKKAADILSEDYEDLVYLFADELFEVLKQGKMTQKYHNSINKRKAKRPLAEAYRDRSVEILLASSETGISGVAGSLGKVRGRVKIISGPSEFDKLNKGEILVCPHTDPEWTVLFSLAAAVVVDTGGTLSHAAIVAREYQIPAVLATGNATTLLRDGDVVVVDGTKGIVNVL